MKTMRIIISALALMATVAVGVQAEDYGVKFWRTNGDTICITFDKNPCVRLLGNNMEIASDDMNLKVAIDDVSKWTIYTVVPTAIIGPAAQKGICVNVNGDMVTVSGLAKGAKVNLATADGQRLATAKADTNGQARLAIGSLDKAVYILQAGKQAVKFVKN